VCVCVCGGGGCRFNTYFLRILKAAPDAVSLRIGSFRWTDTCSGECVSIGTKESVLGMFSECVILAVGLNVNVEH
jgi:hypothetical protein